MKLDACGIVTSAQHTLHPLHQVSILLAAGWGHMTSCSQWNVRSDWVTFRLKPRKPPARFSNFFLPRLLGPVIVATRQQCPWLASDHPTPCVTCSMSDRYTFIMLSHWYYNKLLLTDAIPQDTSIQINYKFVKLMANLMTFNVISHTL